MTKKRILPLIVLLPFWLGLPTASETKLTVATGRGRYLTGCEEYYTQYTDSSLKIEYKTPPSGIEFRGGVVHGKDVVWMENRIWTGLIGVVFKGDWKYFGIGAGGYILLPQTTNAWGFPILNLRLGDLNAISFSTGLFSGTTLLSEKGIAYIGWSFGKKILSNPILQLGLSVAPGSELNFCTRFEYELTSSFSAIIGGKIGTEGGYSVFAGISLRKSHGR